jgi:hypothetical protein
MTEGHQDKTAAAELGISVHTVNFHLRSIYEKLHVHSRTEAVARALREGLIHWPAATTEFVRTLHRRWAAHRRSGTSAADVQFAISQKTIWSMP